MLMTSIIAIRRASSYFEKPPCAYTFCSGVSGVRGGTDGPTGLDSIVPADTELGEFEKRRRRGILKE